MYGIVRMQAKGLGVNTHALVSLIRNMAYALMLVGLVLVFVLLLVLAVVHLRLMWPWARHTGADASASTGKNQSRTGEWRNWQ
jgi:hypothetical protein